MTTSMDMGGQGRTYSKQELRIVFVRKYFELLRALFDPRLKKRRWDSSFVEELAVTFARLQSGDQRQGKVPKRVFLLWQQGWEEAPALVQACAQSWAEHNPDWEILLLDDSTLPRHTQRLGSFSAAHASRPARSDIARLCLLSEHGGVWADASVYCSRSLDEWLPAVCPRGYFMFSAPRPYRPVDSWFIASEAGGETIEALREISRQYWGYFRRPHHYFWLIYLFEYLTQTDRRTGEVWDAMPKIPARGPLILGNYAFDTAAPKIVFDLIAARTIPVVKLSHKWRFAGSLAGTPLGALTGLERI